MAVRRELHRRGVRFRVNVRGLSGRPDIALTRARIAVFIDGCFWHGCAAHGVAPKSNSAWWAAKIAQNRARDVRNDDDLTVSGWVVVRAWEHERPSDVVDRVEALWRERTNRSRSY